jgi:hypothetical protein
MEVVMQNGDSKIASWEELGIKAAERAAAQKMVEGVAIDEIPVFMPSSNSVATDADIVEMDNNPHIRYCAMVGSVSGNVVEPWDQDPTEWDTAAAALRDAQEVNKTYSEDMDAGVMVVYVEAFDHTIDDEQREAEAAEQAE